MAILDPNSEMDSDVRQLLGLMQDLSEQLNQNRTLSVALFGQAGEIKNQAIHSKTGFVLRRFNLDKSKEAYEAELERMNNALSSENQALQHDNKQLNTLIKEYEQTLETLMSSFRNRARDVQERELSLIREYETKLLAREEAIAAQELDSSTAVSEAIARISHLLRQFLRSHNGEDAEEPSTRIDDAEDREPWTAPNASEYALERECELARLEKENEELRRMMGLVGVAPRRPAGGNTERHTFEPPAAQRKQYRIMGGASGTVGPFGTYKRRTPERDILVNS